MRGISPQFDFLFNNLDKMAYFFKDETHFGPVNQKMAQFCNLKQSDLENKSVSMLLNKKEYLAVKKFNQRVFQQGLAKKSKIEIIIEAESYIIEVETIPHQNDQGKVDYLLCLADDITEKLKKEKQFYKNKKRYRSLFEKAPLAFIVSDRKTNIIDWNNKAEEIFGWQKKEALNKNFNLILADDSYFEITELMENVFEGRESYQLNKNIRKDGTEIYCEWNNALIKDQDDQILEIISVAQDISEKIEAREKIKYQKKELEYSELRAQFFANISHELKTPLNLIFSSLQLLEYQLKNKEVAELEKFNRYLASIRNNGYRLLRLVNNLIDITKIDVDSFQLPRSNTDIVKLIDSIVETIADYLKTKNRNFRFESNLESKIIGLDAFNIERVILNLISNSVKFTSEGDEILLKLEEEGGFIKIIVRDTGIGIAEENKAVVFERFRQVDQKFNKEREGSGIGLSLVKSIVEMHGGKIELESIYGIYSKFIISLPAEKISQDSLEDRYTADNLLNKVELEFSDINYL